jgi:hypothetical protein
MYIIALCCIFHCLELETFQTHLTHGENYLNFADINDFAETTHMKRGLNLKLPD